MRGAGGGASPECITVADQHLEHVSQRGWTVLCGGRDCVIAALIRGATRVPGPAQHQKLRMPSRQASLSFCCKPRSHGGISFAVWRNRFTSLPRLILCWRLWIRPYPAFPIHDASPSLAAASSGHRFRNHGHSPVEAFGGSDAPPQIVGELSGVLSGPAGPLTISCMVSVFGKY